jgi:TolA-binding protein
MIKRSLSLLALLLTLMVLPGHGQRSSIHDEPDATYRQALELFSKERYGAARKLFLETIVKVNDPRSEVHANALYHAGVCALHLFNPDAEVHLMEFINHHPTHPRQNMARFHMGNLKYRDRQYRESVRWFAQVDTRPLSDEQVNEYRFKRGYGHLMTDDLASARQFMFQVNDPASHYYGPAQYYFGHIAYMQGDHQTALTAFEKLVDDRNFGPIVPYYITHIYYLQEKYDELLAYAPALLEDATARRGPEIARLVGEAHFRRGAYREALPYLETYINETRTRITREDHYQIGFAYYSTRDYENAIRHFERVTSGNDLLAQNAWYHLASAYLETNQKRFARNAFQAAYQMKFDENIRQDALFNYAKLSFELSLDPYNEAILSFQRYIADYPRGERVEEAYRHLVDLFLTTRNYKDALASIEQIQINTPRLREAYQRIAYFRGVELFNNGDFRGAIAHFDKSRRFTDNRNLAAQALYWKGEAHYRLEQYNEAIAAHEAFLVSPGAFSLPVYNRANYSIGYSHFKLQNYPRAITAFRKFLGERGEDARLVNDATLRVADSYFITKNYPLALEYYDRAISQGAIDTDYAIFQKGLVMGVTGRFPEKITAMQQLLSRHPNSNFVADAKYEIANSHLILDNSAQALNFFGQVINSHPNSSYVKSAMLKTGLIHYNNNEDERALQVFKNVVNKYPGTPESQEALVAIRTIYVSLDQVDEYFRFSQGLGFANVTTAQQDSLTYMAAENRYMQGDCQNATRSFAGYLERFPNGIFALNAHFYKAECEFRMNELRQALAGYQFVISRPRSKFTENALLRASQIEFRQSNFDAAYNYYRQLEEVAEIRNNVLEARIGQMRSLYRLERNQDAIAAAERVIATDKVPEEVIQEAHLVKGNASMSINNLGQARSAFREVIRLADNVSSAEAMYNLALIEFRRGNYQQAEELIFQYTGNMSAYGYWLAKAYILLADTYAETGNTFQAKHTLQSIIDNYEGEDLRAQAQQKLQRIIEMERASEQPHQPDTLEIDLRNGVF